MPSRPELTGDPHPHLARLRAQAPIVWVDALAAWLVVGRSAALEVMRDAERFTVDDPRFTTGRVVGPSMLSLDGDDHTRHRAAFSAAFRPSHAPADLVSWLEQSARDLVVQSRRAQGADLRSDLAAPLPAAAIVHVLGLVDVASADATRWFRLIVREVDLLTANPDHIVDRSVMSPLREAVTRTVAYGGALADIRATSALDDEEFAANVAVVIFGALETAEAMIANLLWHVLQRPAILAQLIEDPSARDRAVEESLRLEPAAAVIDRFATADTTVAGVSITAGDPVTVSLAAANRDPTAYAEPHRFVLDRGDEPAHLAFVVGPHGCLGSHLARAEARAALDAVLDGSSVPILVDVDDAAPDGLVFRKPPRLSVRW